MTRTTLVDQAQALAKRKVELGLSGRGYVPANSGKRRTAGKRALLRRLRRGRKPAFAANID